MKHKKTLSLLISGAALAATAFVANIGPSQPAEASTSNCPRGAVCVWADPFYTTNNDGDALIAFHRYIPSYWGWRYHGTHVNGANTASSIYSNARYEVAYMYGGINGTNYLFDIRPKDGNGNMAAAFWLGHNDNIESGGFHSFLRQLKNR